MLTAAAAAAALIVTKRGRQPLLPLLLLLLLLLHRRTLGQLGTAARQGSSLLARVPALHNRNKHNYVACLCASPAQSQQTQLHRPNRCLFGTGAALVGDWASRVTGRVPGGCVARHGCRTACRMLREDIDSAPVPRDARSRRVASPPPAHETHAVTVDCPRCP